MSAASPTIVGGLIFCISATPHLGSLFPLLHGCESQRERGGGSCRQLSTWKHYCRHQIRSLLPAPWALLICGRISRHNSGVTRVMDSGQRTHSALVRDISINREGAQPGPSQLGHDENRLRVELCRMGSVRTRVCVPTLGHETPDPAPAASCCQSSPGRNVSPAQASTD